MIIESVGTRNESERRVARHPSSDPLRRISAIWTGVSTTIDHSEARACLWQQGTPGWEGGQEGVIWNLCRNGGLRVWTDTDRRHPYIVCAVPIPH